MAKGYYGARKNVWTVAKNAVEKGLLYAYSGRKQRKRQFRSLWIQRINAAVRPEGLTYSQFMHGTKLAGIELDRKVMADLAMNEAAAFKAIVEQAKKGFSLVASGARKGWAFVKGKVEETLPAVELPLQIAVLRLDTDFYASTAAELKTLWSKLSPGGWLYVDRLGSAN